MMLAPKLSNPLQICHVIVKKITTHRNIFIDTSQILYTKFINWNVYMMTTTVQSGVVTIQRKHHKNAVTVTDILYFLTIAVLQ